MQYIIGVVIGVFACINWDSIHPFVISVLESILTFIK